MEYFNEFSNTTTYVKMANLPKVAGAFKSAMLNYQYASNCAWYEGLKNADTVKAIFDVFNIKFSYDKVNQTFTPIIKDIEAQAGIKDALKKIAPYMENGCIYAKDTYRYYTISFENGIISGKVRKVNEVGDTDNKIENKPTTSTNKPIQKNKQTRASKKPNKQEKKTDFRFSAPTTTPQTIKRDDNTYTVAELVKELLIQMDKGNGSKYITVSTTTDFLFDTEKYA